MKHSDLKVGERYARIGSPNWQRIKCIGIDDTIHNNGYNQYYKVATFEITADNMPTVKTNYSFDENEQGVFTHPLLCKIDLNWKNK